MVPKGWIVQVLDSVFPVIDSLHQTPVFSYDGYPMVRVTDIKGGNLDLGGAVKVSRKIFDDYTKKYKPKQGDIVFSRVGSYGNSSYVSVNDPFCLGQNTVVAKSTGVADPYFVFQSLNSEYVKEQVEKQVDGSSHKTISLKIIRQLRLLLPPLPEQRKIAQILSTWDKAIATTECLLTNRQQQKKALMQRLLTGKQRFAGFEGEWVTVTIDDVIVVGRGFAFKSESYVESGLKIVRVTNISDSGDIDLKTNCVFVSVESVETYKNYYLQDGDVLLVMVGATAGKLGFVTPQNLPSLLNQNMWYLRTKNESNLLQSFLKYIIRGTVSKYLDSQQGSARGFFTQSTFNKLELRIPKDIDEQQKIASVLSAADAEISTIQNQLDNLKQQKKALMQQLLTGKRRVKVDSPALATQ